jgi:hypothetical protein
MAKHVDVWVTIQQKYVYFNLFNHDLTVDSKKWIIYNQKNGICEWKSAFKLVPPK